MKNKRHTPGGMPGAMKRRMRPLMDAATSEGGEIIEVERRSGGHLCLTMSVGTGETRKLFIAATPSDKRSDLNSVSMIRRTVRQLKGE